MPCGDSSAFPVEAATKLGQALVNKQITLALFVPACDVACYFATKIQGDGGDDPVPVPVPRTFGAGLDEVSDDDLGRAGNMLLAMAEQHEQGGDKAMAAGAFPWAAILSAIGPVIQAIILALGKSPIPKPGQ